MSLPSSVAGLRRPAPGAELKSVQKRTGSTAKARWAHIANTWRLMAERLIAARTGGELSGCAAAKPASAPMRYQQSFYSLG